MKRPWMPLYVDDYQLDTLHLKRAQHGSYLLLIIEYWRRGKLPRDETHLAQIAHMTDAEWKRERETFVGLFGPNWTHKRIDEELRRVEEVSEKRRAAGSHGGFQKAANVIEFGNQKSKPSK